MSAGSLVSGTAASGVETSHVGLTITDLERSLGFYRDLLGLELVDRWTADEPRVGETIGSPGAELEVALLRLPNTRAYLELAEYKRGGGAPIDPLHGNPGSCHVAFYTDDMDETWATLEAAGSENQGDGITPIVGGVFDGGKAIYCTDPDGIRVEFLEGPAYLDGSGRDPDAVPKTARANETTHCGLHVTDLERSLEFWVDRLGFEVAGKFVAEDPGTRGVIGLPEASLNLAILRLPGTNAFMEVIEYQNAPGRHEVDPDTRNPGTCHVALYVEDLDATWAALAAAGSEAVSGGIVDVPDGIYAGGRVIYCTDPEGFRVQLVQSDSYMDGSSRTAQNSEEDA
jgi:catechol 2,3-dioxygenase-like lactoylglutathione lyase family enzyme